MRSAQIDINHVNKIDCSKTYCIAVISNPVRYYSRIELYKDFEKHVLSTGAQLITVEAAFGDRPFVITEKGNPSHIQLRTFDELWHKENMINIAMNRLALIDPMWEKVIWLDGDVRFAREDWVHEATQQLEHYMVVQMFSEAIDLGPNYEYHQRYKSFAWCWHENKFEVADGIVQTPYHPYGPNGPKYYWHPGFAWGYRREALHGLGTHAGAPFLDYPCIFGAGDHHMALSLIGQAEKSYPPSVHPNYVKAIQEWQSAALRIIKKDIGYVPGILLAGWHGNKVNRGYWSRWKIMTDNDFNPETDLRRDDQGLFILVVEDERQRRIRDQMRAYFRSRKEDSIDVNEKTEEIKTKG